MPLLSALLAVHAYSAPLAGRPAVTRAAAGAITMGGNQKVVGFDDIEGIPFESSSGSQQKHVSGCASRTSPAALAASQLSRAQSTAY